MILLGIILLILGFVLTVHILWILGIVVLVVGLILALLGATGRAIGGRARKRLGDVGTEGMRGLNSENQQRDPGDQ